MFVGIGSDEAGVHREPFAAHQAFAQAAFHHGLEEVPQDVALPEPTMAVAREGGMVRNLTVQSQTAEPSIGEVEVNLLAEPPLGPNTHAISNDQHPHHQLGSDRGTAHGAVEWLQLSADAFQINELVDPTKEVVYREHDHRDRNRRTAAPVSPAIPSLSRPSGINRSMESRHRQRINAD